MDQTFVSQIPDLAGLFPDWAQQDSRPGYQGYVIQTNRLTDVAIKLRDDLGFDYLTSLTGVDYIAENKLEVVYHLAHTVGGPGIELKVQVDRENPVVPSLTHIYRGAEFQEREAFDLLGIRFKGPS